MAIRNILHRKHLPALIEWLGPRSLPTKGEREAARWKNSRPGAPMCIVFDNDKSPEHLSSNDAAFNDVKKFLWETKNPCTWTQVDKDGDTYETGCGGSFWIENGTPENRDMIYCTYCGKRIKQVLHEESEKGRSSTSCSA